MTPISRVRGMSLPFGKYKGELVEKIVLTHPDYIAWLLNQPSLPQYKFVLEHINWCIQIFNSKPFTDRQCSSYRPCSNPVTRISLYKHNPSPYYWCQSCDPYSSGAIGNVLTLVRTYQEALNYVEFVCGSKKSIYENLIQTMHNAKGLTGRRTTEKILAFFHG